MSKVDDNIEKLAKCVLDNNINLVNPWKDLTKKCYQFSFIYERIVQEILSNTAVLCPLNK